MSSDSDHKYPLSSYDKSTLLVRKDYMPLICYLGKREYSYWLTMPPTDNKDLNERFFRWFHNDFVEIISQIIKKRNIVLPDGQEKPSKAGGKYGWYLPLAVLLELQKMWHEENVPITVEILRPADLIYGKGWTKRDIINVMEEYLYNNPDEVVKTNKQEKPRQNV